jgi:hypothetical protein
MKVEKSERNPLLTATAKSKRWKMAGKKENRGSKIQTITRERESGANFALGD